MSTIISACSRPRRTACPCMIIMSSVTARVEGNPCNTMPTLSPTRTHVAVRIDKSGNRCRVSGEAYQWEPSLARCDLRRCHSPHILRNAHGIPSLALATRRRIWHRFAPVRRAKTRGSSRCRFVQNVDGQEAAVHLCSACPLSGGSILGIQSNPYARQDNPGDEAAGKKQPEPGYQRGPDRRRDCRDEW
ncbi:exported hypothetical protein [Mesorhizobium sp. STM 4661]|nr:exported hypothetical protein [Mesorhizobium sp. STM 4661]